MWYYITSRSKKHMSRNSFSKVGCCSLDSRVNFVTGVEFCVPDSQEEEKFSSIIQDYHFTSGQWPSQLQVTGPLKCYVRKPWVAVPALNVWCSRLARVIIVRKTIQSR